MFNTTKSGKQKVGRVGYVLRVSFDKGESFDLRGGLFTSRYLAEKFHQLKYKHLPKRVQGVRVNFEKVSSYANK